MNEPWFNPNVWGWLPATVFGSTVGIWGSLAGYLAPQGRGRKFVLGAGWAYFGIALVFLAGGVLAWSSGQPYGVWYGFALPGVLGVILLPSILPQIYRRYHEAETRRMEAQNL
jgi:hypothetical protein